MVYPYFGKRFTHLLKSQNKISPDVTTVTFIHDVTRVTSYLFTSTWRVSEVPHMNLEVNNLHRLRLIIYRCFFYSRHILLYGGRNGAK